MNGRNPKVPPPELDDPEVAFEAMSRRLAGLTAAVEGFAARQQELHARDYGPDLAKIHERQEKVRAAILTLGERPAMALTPELIALQIETAGAQGRAADHQAWTKSSRELGRAVQSLDGVVASALAAKTQRLWLAAAATAALVIGFAMGMIVPARIAQAVPESWYWPEARAASELQRDGWGAGMRLLEVADPRRWEALSYVARIASSNAVELTACRSRASRAGKAVKCTIEVDPTE
jgi:hypothetical protein